LAVGVQNILSNTTVSPKNISSVASKAVASRDSGLASGSRRQTKSSDKRISIIASITGAVILIISVTIGIGDNAEAISKVISLYTPDASRATEDLTVRVQGDQSNAS
jgi:hypothetical protein